ncbi:MAG: TolC family protein [Candidatus Schekmanbacteria bacterium]|nr:TolC family protein [Candidatus Schekmanbacteria bacterium]
MIRRFLAYPMLAPWVATALLTVAGSQIAVGTSAVGDPSAPAPAAGSASAASSAPSRIAADLQQILAQALAGAPELAVADARKEAALARVSPAGALPDPALELSSQAMGLPVPERTLTSTLEWLQRLPYPGKRQARTGSAVADLSMRDTQIVQLRAAVGEQVRVLFGTIYALDQELHALDDAAALIATMGKVVGARYSAGQASREAFLKIEVEAGRVRNRRAGVAAERSREVAELVRLAGLPPEAELGPVDALPASGAAPAPPLAPEVLEQAPDLQVAQAEVAVAASKLREAALDERPDFMLMLGLGLDQDQEPMAMVRVGIDLPAWRRRKQAPLTLAAQHDLRASTAELQAERSRLLAELVGLRAEWRRATDVGDQYRQAIVPSTRAAFEAALAAYVTGQGDFSTVLEDFNLLIEARTELARAEAERFIAWAHLLRLTSGPIATTSGGTL